MLNRDFTCAANWVSSILGAVDEDEAEAEVLPPSAGRMESRKGYEATARRSRGLAGKETFGCAGFAVAREEDSSAPAASIADWDRNCRRVFTLPGLRSVRSMISTLPCFRRVPPTPLSNGINEIRE